jgi:glycosyltransferase involved in cell wall biosynthesis
VHALAPASFGGLERVVQMLAEGQAARGHAVHVVAVVTPSPERHPFAGLLRDAGIPAIFLELPGRSYFAERRAIERICRAVDADVLHTHGYRPDVIDSGAARALGIPRVSTVHGFTGGGWCDRLYERLQLNTLRRFDAVIAVARPQIDRLAAAGISRDRIHLITNAWAPSQALNPGAARAELGVPPAAFHIGWVGRLSPEKAPELFLEAIAQLADLPFVASIVGEGTQRPALEELAAQLGIADRVRWHGPKPQAGRLFQGFDAFVLSSRTEGTPMVLLEAMASRTPIVATAVGGVPDVVSAAEAQLVTPGNPDSLAAAIRAVYVDPAAAAARAEHARTRLEKQFAYPAWISRHEALYDQLILAT